MKNRKVARQRTSKKVELKADYGRNKKGDKIIIDQSIEKKLKDKKVI